MKSTFFIPLMLLFGGFVLFSACNTSRKTDRDAVVYTCSMHPEVMGKKGAKCPKCHMSLQKQSMEAMGCCPMHKECTGAVGSKCPKCSMPMDHPVEPYSCPMHPDQKGSKGDHCPKCHMDLEPQKPQKGNG